MDEIIQAPSCSCVMLFKIPGAKHVENPVEFQKLCLFGSENLTESSSPETTRNLEKQIPPWMPVPIARMTLSEERKCHPAVEDLKIEERDCQLLLWTNVEWKSELNSPVGCHR